MNKKDKAKLSNFFRIIIDEADENERFAEKLLSVIEGEKGTEPRPSPKRAPAILNPYDDYEKGEDVLSSRLDQLSVEQLKDIVAEHGMDQSKLAMKWKNKERLKELIQHTVKLRFHKGEVFEE